MKSGVPPQTCGGRTGTRSALDATPGELRLQSYPACSAAPSRTATGSTLMARLPRRVPNSTVPATRANRVSSPPRPTPGPGWKCVPCWRTMISPALTTCPPNRLTPSRWAFESRPFRLDEAPFLCAMVLPLPRLSKLARRRNTGDLDLGVRLAVTHAPLVPGLVPVVHDVDLGALDRAEDF